MGPDKGAIDWDEAKRRLDEAGRALERGLTRREKDELLKRRAALLAAGMEEKGPEGTVGVVEFLIGRERYAIESRYLREARRVAGLTPVPCTPDFVAGVFNLRGEIVSAVDLRRLFGIPGEPAAAPSMAIVLDDGTNSFAVLADEVVGSGAVAPGELTPSLASVTGAAAEYLSGVGPTGLIVLDGSKLLKSGAMVVNETVE